MICHNCNKDSGLPWDTFYNGKNYCKECIDKAMSSLQPEPTTAEMLYELYVNGKILSIHTQDSKYATCKIVLRKKPFNKANKLNADEAIRAAYKKQSDTVKEFAEKVAAELYPEAMKYLNTDIGKGIAKAMVKVEEIAASFGVEEAK